MAETANETNQPKGLIWIASYPKSGNTWTRNFLHNLFDVIEDRDSSSHDINRLNQFSTWELNPAYYEELLGKPVADMTRQDVASVRHAVQEQIAERASGVAFVKTHHAMVMDQGRPAINFNVTAGAIYIVRNPLDVAISFSHHMNVDIDTAIVKMAADGLETAMTEKSVYEIYGSWRQHVESWTRKPHRTIYVMRYEDMLADPVKVFGGLARHLRIAPTGVQLEQAIELSSFENLREQEETEGFREKPEHAEKFFRKGTSGQWLNDLTENQIRQIISDHRTQMQRFGYVPKEFGDTG